VDRGISGAKGREHRPAFDRLWRGAWTGALRYKVTFARSQTPPVHGFWSVMLYNEHHFFSPNAINRYSVGTKNKDLKPNSDSSLTVYVQVDEPPQDLCSNWLPAPAGRDFSLYVRAYWAKVAVTDGSWTPPAVQVETDGDQHRKENVQ